MNIDYKFTVLMSVYKKDKPKELEISIQSILNQTLPPNQIVIVQDGPLTNDLYEVIDKYKEYKDLFCFVELEENVGLGNALNVGLNHCIYNYVARMDSDDFSLPTRFEEQMKYLMEHPNVDIVGSYIEEFDENMENSLAIRAVPCCHETIKKLMKTRNGMNHVTVIYKKDKVIEAGNYMDCLYFEDYYLWCRMIQKGMIFHNLKEVLVNVRTGNEMYKRRGGSVYNKSILNFEKKILELGFIDRIEYIKNVMIRLIVSNMPNQLRSVLYKKKLRK